MRKIVEIEIVPKRTLRRTAKDYASKTYPYCDADLEPYFSERDLVDAFERGYYFAFCNAKGKGQIKNGTMKPSSY